MFVKQEDLSLKTLKAELANDPAKLGYAPLIAIADYRGILGLLATVVTTAIVPVSRDVILQWFAGNSRITKLQKASTDTTTVIPGVGDLASIVHVAQLLLDPTSTITTVDFSDPQIQGFVDALAFANVLDAEDKASSLLLGKVSVTRMQQLWGLETALTEQDLTMALVVAPPGYLMLLEAKADDTIVAFFHAQEHDHFCYMLNKTRYEAILQTGNNGDFRQRITQLLAETNARIAEVEQILVATQAQLPSQDRIDAARARLLAAGTLA